MSVIKDIILWKYERASWQWDVLCLLIMAFIFLTPKSWFDERDTLPPRKPSVSSNASAPDAPPPAGVAKTDERRVDGPAH